MLNGSGYPDAAKADDIPTEARILAITDVFDALVANDRPYKKAMPVDRALDILKSMAGEGKLDGELVDLFVKSGAYIPVEE
jgi:HD-GYP domain-containing protein (c-di-GMP phosphodiesterase class II)